MIARIWRGAVRKQDRDEYTKYMRRTGVAAYAATVGNRGVWMLRRDVDDLTEFVMFTLWDSLDALKAFAGEDETAVFYPEDEPFLVERDLRASHFEVDAYESQLRRPAGVSTDSANPSTSVIAFSFRFRTAFCPFKQNNAVPRKLGRQYHPAFLL